MWTTSRKHFFRKAYRKSITSIPNRPTGALHQLLEGMPKNGGMTRVTINMPLIFKQGSMTMNVELSFCWLTRVRVLHICQVHLIHSEKSNSYYKILLHIRRRKHHNALIFLFGRLIIRTEQIHTSWSKITRSDMSTICIAWSELTR
jgi:hypothetical protein